MPEEISITEVAEALSRVQFNYSNLAQSWYNIFYNTTPMDVQLEFYDVDGNAHTYVIPNRAKDKSYITNGEYADPSDNVSAPIGTLYQSTTTGDVYIKMIGEGATGWIKMISQSDLDRIIVQKAGDPNETGEVRAFGTLYIDISTGYMYMRRQESTEDFKWDRIDSYSTALLSETFTVYETTNEFVLNGICQSKEVLFVYENGVLINPATYTMPYNDNRTVHLEYPVVVPETEESVEVVIRYFIDTHVAESTAQADMLNYVTQCRTYAIGDYNPEGGDDQSCKWYYLQMKDIKLNLEEQIAGIDAKYQECKDALDYYYEQYHEEFLRIQRETVNYIDTNAEQFTAGVTKVYNYSVQVAEQTQECTKMWENVQLAEKNTIAYADYVRETVLDMATKTELEEVRTTLTDSINANRNSLLSYVDQNVAVINSDIESTRQDVLNQLATEVTNITANFNSLYDVVTNQINTAMSWIEVHEDLADFQNETGFIRDDNFPIDTNGIYKYKRDIVGSTNLSVSVEKNCSYYSIDIGEVMAQASSDLEFSFTIAPGSTINTGMVDTLVDYDGIVSVIRVFFKNDTDYSPIIRWDETMIDWLGEEPELEAGKDYIIEFISEDMMSSWRAHALGICQPAIEVDTFSAYFTLRCTAITGDPTLVTQPVSIIMNVDGVQFTMDETYLFNEETGLLTFPMELARKYKGCEISNVGVRCQGVPKFTRYYSTEEFILADDGVYTVNCTNPVTEQHTYDLTVRCADIENYMIENSLAELEVSGKFKVDWGLASTTEITGTYYYDANNEPNSGVVFSFDNDVIPDPMAGEADNYIRGIKLRYADLTCTRVPEHTEDETCLLPCFMASEELIIDVIMDGASATTVDVLVQEAWNDDDLWETPEVTEPGEDVEP